MTEPRKIEREAGRRVDRPLARLPLPRLLLALLPLAFLLLFYFYPVVSILATSLAPQGQFDLAPFSRLFSGTQYLEILWFTLWQAALSTLLTVLLGLPGAYVFARYTFPGKSILRALTTVPFVLPTVVVATAFTALLGGRGRLNLALMALLGLDQPPIDLRGTLGAILLAHVFYNTTLVMRIVGTYWTNLDPALPEAARMLGASRWRAFREVTLPLLAPALGAAALLTFIFCFTSFGVVLILGAGRYATLEVEIFYRTVYLADLPLAAALALIQIVLTFGLMWAYTRLQARVAAPEQLRSAQVTQRQPRSAREWLLVVASVGPALVLLLTPLASLVERSLTVGAGGLGSYRTVLAGADDSILAVPPLMAVRNSLLFALGATLLALVLGGVASIVIANRGRRRSFLSRLLDPLLMLPLGTSAVTLGLGYIVALDEPPLNLRTSPALVVLAHALVALPFVVRSVLPALRSINPALRESAAMLGASPWQVWREIDLPIVARAVGVGAVFAFTVSMGEFGATALIYRPQFLTMPIAIYRLLGRPGVANYGQALAMSTLLMLVCVAGFVGIERFRVETF